MTLPLHRAVPRDGVMRPQAAACAVRLAGAAWHAMRPARRAGAAAVLLVAGLAACTTAPLVEPADDSGAPRNTTASPTTPAPGGDAVLRARARWVPANWSDLPGWDGERGSELWPALLRGCERPPPAWAALCGEARASALPAFSDDAARDFLQRRLQPYRVESLEGESAGLITGYFEPYYEASRTPRGIYRIPLYAPPADLAIRKPYWTRRQIDSLPAAQASLRGAAIAYVADPLDALVMQIQGSGRLRIAEADGSQRLVRLAYAAHNGEPYKSVGRWLIDRGELRPEQALWAGIKGWARAHPERVNEMLWSNPRYVFFREEPLPDPQLGPRGAQAVPLTPGRSIAVDPQSIPYGTPVWLDTTEPLSNTPLRRMVMAQDTGSAITGAVRADYFWGWGDAAEAQAGRMKQALRLWVLWPRP